MVMIQSIDARAAAWLLLLFVIVGLIWFNIVSVSSFFFFLSMVLLNSDDQLPYLNTPKSAAIETKQKRWNERNDVKMNDQQILCAARRIIDTIRSPITHNKLSVCRKVSLGSSTHKTKQTFTLMCGRQRNDAFSNCNQMKVMSTLSRFDRPPLLELLFFSFYLKH